MKYIKQTELQLMRDLERRLQNAFSFKLPADKVNNYINEFLDYHLLTETGKPRYSRSIAKALRLYWLTRQESLENEQLIWCYEIDGELYTTYKNKDLNNFKGITNIQHYRDAGKEEKLLELERAGNTVKRGFFYPCGKPFYTF